MEAKTRPAIASTALTLFVQSPRRRPIDLPRMCPPPEVSEILDPAKVCLPSEASHGADK
jgi:hypothetical protein